jgi:hypothetical protein
MKYKDFVCWINESNVIKGPWGDKPKGPGGWGSPIKIDPTTLWGPGKIQDELRKIGSEKYGHTFKEKPGYFEDFDNEYNSLKYATDLKAIKSLEKQGWNFPTYQSNDLYAGDVRYPQTGYVTEPNEDYYLLKKKEDLFFCARFAQTYCRFWMKVHTW